MLFLRHALRALGRAPGLNPIGVRKHGVSVEAAQ